MTVDIDDLIVALGDDYKVRFPQSLGDLWIKRVTPTVPEAITEWPWLYFVVGDGDVTDLTYGAVQDVAPTRALVPPHVVRNHLLIVHRFKAQLLVRPRRDLVEDETLVRPFITPLLQVAAEKRRGNDWLGLIDLQPTGYKYGVFALGRIEEKAIEFIGVEIHLEARTEA